MRKLFGYSDEISQCFAGGGFPAHLEDRPLGVIQAGEYPVMVHDDGLAARAWKLGQGRSHLSDSAAERIR